MRKKSMENLEEINEIRFRILDNIDDKYDKSQGSFPYDMISPTAFELGFIKSEIDNAKDLLSVENLHGELLNLRVKNMTGKGRNPATHATGYVTVTGKIGTVIPKGFLVAASKVVFRTLEEHTLKGTQAKFLVECLDPGEIGNVPKGTIDEFPVTLNGLETVINDEAFSNGYNEETDEQLRERYYLFMQLPATSGNVAHYKLWAKEVTGVGDVIVNPLWNGNGTVQVIITDSNLMPPDESLIKDVGDYIAEERPIGADVTVNGADKKEITISAKVSLAPGYDLQVVQDNFEAVLEIRRRQLGFNSTYISLGKVGSVLLVDTDGVLDYEDLKLNGEYSNVELERSEIPVFTKIELEVL